MRETPLNTADLTDLRAFCLIVDLGSVTAAAKALGETKSSVSRRLSRLERAVGATLVHRSPRSVRPSEEGATFREHVGRALELMDDATAALQQRKAAPTGLLRMTATHDVGIGVLAPIVGQFKERYPEVGVEMLLTERQLDFDAEQLDFAFRASAGPLPDSPLVGLRIVDADDFDLGLFASPGYLKKRAAPRTPEEIQDHPVLLSFGRRREVDCTFLHRSDDARRSQQRVRAVVTSNDSSFIRELALGGTGLAFVMRRSVARDLASGHLVPVLKEWRLAPPSKAAGVFMLHRGGPFLPPKVRVFREFVLAAVAKTGVAGRAPPA